MIRPILAATYVVALMIALPAAALDLVATVFAGQDRPGDAEALFARLEGLPVEPG